MAEDHVTHYNTDEASAEPEFAEMDPTGRYGRYNEILGKGAFKTVYRAFDEVDGIEVAWNQVKVQDLLQSPEELERLYSEVNLLKSLKHKNIIKFYTSWVDAKNKNVNFITEIFNSGTLRQYRKKHKHVDIRAVKSWARQILRGLLYLHSHDPPIIHRDLKCDNVFVNGNNGEVKIGDLGLATILRQAHAAHSVIGTPEFMAPELYEEEYNELVDIYSFGMCMLEIVTFDYPYSECTNAAQIYKKVTSGKKPAALDKVKDPEVRKFIENCLAVASKRLPARELLSDPFLQCDINKEQSECPPIPALRPELGGDDLEGVAGKEEPGSSICRRFSKLEHAEPRSIEESKVTMKSVSSNEALSNSDCDSGTLSGILKDDQLQKSRDFRVKGKKKDESTVSLRLRIADPQGHARHIHFVFDIESDTAISVASEMVEELQLSDQDVTTVAEMIDAQILALVPDWKPGASFDDATPDTGHSDQDRCLPDLSCKILEDEIHVDGATSDVCCMTNSLIAQDIYSSVLGPSVTADESPARGEGMMYGRFEDVTYNQGGSDYSPSSSGVPPPISSITFDHQALEDSLLYVGVHTSPDFDPARRDSTGAAHESSSFLKPTTAGCDADLVEAGCMAFNDLVECQRNAGCSKYTHQTWEAIMNMAASPDEPGAYAEADMHEMDKGFHSPVPWASGASTVVTPTDLTDGEEELDQELRVLAFEQGKELIELRRRHEIAISEARSRWEKRSGSSLSSKLVRSGLQSDDVSTSDIMHASSALKTCLYGQGVVSGCVVSTQGSHGSVSPPLGWEAQLATVRDSSTSRKSVDSDRLSLEELSAMTKQIFEENTERKLIPQALCQNASEIVNNVGAMHVQLEATVIGPAASGEKIDVSETGGEGQEHVPQEGDLQVVSMACVGEICVPFDNSCPFRSHRCETAPWDTQEVRTHGVYSTGVGIERVGGSMVSLCNSKNHLDELESRHIVPDGIMDGIALNGVELHNSVCPSSELLEAKAELGDMQGSFLEFHKKSEDLCQAAQSFGSLLQGSAAPVSVHPDRVTYKSESSIIRSTGESSGSCAEAQVCKNKLQALDSLKRNSEKQADQPKMCRAMDGTDALIQERFGHCTTFPTVSMTHQDKSCTRQLHKAATESQGLPYKPSTNFQMGDGSLESKKEQLQRSIARLEAKTLEGLQIGLVANLGTKKVPTGSTSATSQSRPNSGSESSKH